MPFDLDPRDILHVMLVMCGVGIGLIVGLLIGFRHGQHTALLESTRTISKIHNRHFAAEAAAAVHEAKARVGR